MIDTLLEAPADELEAYRGKWRNFWLCIDGSSFWGSERHSRQECLDTIAKWLEGAREIEANTLTTCVFYGDVIADHAPMIRRRILNYTVIPLPFFAQFPVRSAPEA